MLHWIRRPQWDPHDIVWYGQPLCLALPCLPYSRSLVEPQCGALDGVRLHWPHP